MQHSPPALAGMTGRVTWTVSNLVLFLAAVIFCSYSVEL